MAAPVVSVYTAPLGATIYGGRWPGGRLTGTVSAAAVVAAGEMAPEVGLAGNLAVAAVAGAGNLGAEGPAFASVSHTGDVGGTVPTGAAQVTYIYLHGSGGAAPAFGALYTGVVPSAGAYPDNLAYSTMDRLLWSVRTMPGESMSASVPYGLIEPWDNNGTYPGGQTRQAYWMGFTADDYSGLRLYKERHLRMLLQWLRQNYPQMSATKRYLAGRSMGGWGTGILGLRHPELVAAIYPEVPRWRYGLDGSGTGPNVVRIPHWPSGPLAYAPGSAPLLDAADGGYSAASHMDAVAYAANAANPMPWVGWAVGRNDGYTPFADHIAMHDACIAGNRGYAWTWNAGDHTTGGTIISDIYASYTLGMFEIGVGYPIYRNCSRDQDPRVDAAGGVNLGFQHRNVRETANTWTCEIRNLLGACTVNVAPHSDIFAATVAPQAVSVPAGAAWVTVNFSA